MKIVYLIYCERSEVESLGMSYLLESGEKVDNVFTYTIDCVKKQNLEIKYYEYFDKYKTPKKLKKIINDINNDDLEEIGLLTDKKDLFEFFDAEIYITKFRNHFNNKKDTKVKIDTNTMVFNLLDNLVLSKKNDLACEISIYFSQFTIFESLNLFNKYNEVFEINIKKLLKHTAYEDIKSFKELNRLMNEDIKIFFHYNLITSRLGIVLKRLCDFNLNQSSKEIGKELKKFFKMESVSYKYKFKRKFINSDLSNKNFRAYKIGTSLTNYEETKFKDQLEIFNKLKKNKVDDNILKEAFGKVKFFTINNYIKTNRINDKYKNYILL
jgi:hypothetical protein